MKNRLSLSVDETTAEYLTKRAQRETRGNVSALVDRLVRAARLTESVQAEAVWYAAHPGHAEDAEAERTAAGAA